MSWNEIVTNRRQHGLIVTGSVIAAWALAYALWPYIVLPYSNPLGITGLLTEIHFNPANNVARYGLFIIAPAAGFFLARGHRWARLPMDDETAATAVSRYAMFGVFGLLVVTQVLWILAGPAGGHPLDFLHDGESLSAAYNYLATGKLWTGTFFVHGLFYDVGRSLVAWHLFGHQSIGALQVFSNVSSNLAFVALAVLLAVMTWAVWRESGSSRALAMLGAMLVAYCVTEGVMQNPNERDIYAFVAAALSVIAVTRPRLWLTVVTGFIAGLGMFNTIERGAYVTLATLSVWALLLMIRRERRDAAHLGAYLAGFVGALCVVALIVGGVEFHAFARDLGYWIRHKELMDGYIYPQPSADAFYTLPLVFNAVSFLLWAAAVPLYVEAKHWERLAVDTFIVASACLFYRSALGRGDAMHVQYVGTLAYVAFAWMAAGWLPRKIVRATAVVTFAALLLVVIFRLYAIALNLEGIATFPERVRFLVACDDNAFLNQSQQTELVRFKAAFADETCSFVEPPWPAMHYLLRKPSCGRFYLSWFATAEPFQKELIATLEETHPKHVVLWPEGRPGIDEITSDHLYRELDAYLHAHYRPEEVQLHEQPGLTGDRVRYFGFSDWVLGTRIETP